MTGSPFPPDIAAVIFDMDGLLLDSEVIYRDAFLTAGDALGFGLTEPFFLSLVGLSARTIETMILERFGADFPLQAFRAGIQRRLQLTERAGIALKTGVVELLEHLQAAGVACAVATSSSRAAVERNLGPADILHHFDAVVTGDDVRRGKPDPEPFLLAAERLGVPPAQCIALEDSHNGVRAAHAAGMAAVMVPDLLPATDEMRSLCALVAADLHEVRLLLAATDGEGL